MKEQYPIELECDKVQVWPDGIMVFNGEEFVVSCAGFPLLKEEVTEADFEWARKRIAELRSQGPVSQERALEVAERAADLDDSEGLGKIRVT